MATFYKDEIVKYTSYTDTEKHTGKIEYFTEEGIKTVAAIRENGRIVLIQLSDLEKLK